MTLPLGAGSYRYQQFSRAVSPSHSCRGGCGAGAVDRRRDSCSSPRVSVRQTGVLLHTAAENPTGEPATRVGRIPFAESGAVAKRSAFSPTVGNAESDDLFRFECDDRTEFVTPNVLSKLEFVTQHDNNFPTSDIRGGGQFRGFVAEGAVAFMRFKKEGRYGG